MVTKVNELREAEFIDQWSNGFGWIAKPEENMQRTSHGFVDDDGGVYSVDPVDAENLDEKISKFGYIKGCNYTF